MLISLGGCALPQTPQSSQSSQAPQTSQSGSTTIQWTSDDGQNAEKMAQEIIRCLINKDKESFNALFCKPIRETECFTEYVGNLYSMFNYDSYIGYRCDDMRSTFSKEGEREVFRQLQAEIIYIEVPMPNGEDTRFYGLEWYWVLTCEDDPELVGIHQLTIRLLNTDHSITVGNQNNLP